MISKKSIFKIIGTFVAFGVCGFLLLYVINWRIVSDNQPLIYEDWQAAPHAQAALLLGARVYSDGRLSDILKDRANTALDLYNNGQVEKILVSGDHGQTTYDEVNAMRDYLLEAGVAPEDLFLDHAGFDTYDSVYRAKYIFQAESLLIVTQNFHLPRALFIARSVGVEAYGVSADRHQYVMARYNDLREILARVKAYGEVLINAQPKYLGEAIPLSGDSKKSWDRE
ncbi:MAG TPA: ElyC/SanA/YdcF family protein [bacterium]|nr:ElyC/SanA/YdcF family protein [bacterium]